jgi:hypothetical protein
MQIRMTRHTCAVLFAAVTFWACSSVAAQTSEYDSFTDQQKQLFAGISAQIDKQQGRKIAPDKRFAALPSSERATFSAVTNALANTELSDSNGNSLGLAIDLIGRIEMIAGARPGKGSDEQYRLYVTVRGDTVTILERSREFKRGKDNTRYHKGYPRNYRQAGSAPTLQFSITKDGARADIDVDYRPGSFPAGLFNGHLTASNSDVRAPGNYFTHVLRWPGLIDYWRPDLTASFAEFASTRLKPLDQAFIDGSSKPEASGEEMVRRSADEFLRLWIERRDPDRAVNFVGTSFLTCPARNAAAFDPMFEARLRVLFYNLLKAANKGLGGRKALAEVIEPYGRADNWLDAPLAESGLLYSMAKVRPGRELSFACRSSSRPARPIQTEYYVTTFKFRSNRGDGGILSLLWAPDAGLWRIQAFDAISNQSP